jgi:hypothetical protein
MEQQQAKKQQIVPRGVVLGSREWAGPRRMYEIEGR